MSASHVLAWSPIQQIYTLNTGATMLGIIPESTAWFAWLDEVASFAFHSQTGDRWTVRKETVQRGGGYWYAYRRVQGRMVKRYLGRSAKLTLARLAAIGATLSNPPPAIAQAPHLAEQVFAQPSLLLSTKLQVPHTLPRLVSRPHVIQRLQRGLERPLTVIAAPAGFGKSTALKVWAHTVPYPIAWVSLDASDNDPGQFWTYVLTVLNMRYPGVASTALAMLQAHHLPAMAVIVRTLLNAIARYADEVVLALDDYHLITTPAIHEALALCLEHPPAQWHLYLASRTEPPFPLARLRAYDQVNEIRPDDLRFRPDEIAAFFLDVMGVQLAADDITTLAERADGWVTGLQLAGQSLQGHPDPARFIASFSGSHRHVMTYLGEEVLAAQPAEVQSFLFQTALLERMCVPLCDAITGRQDGHAMLAHLQQANLFLVALDDEGRWYRYHHLFGDLLRHRLQQDNGKLLPTLHRRAARWLADEGWIVEAAEHLFAVPALDDAAHLIERSASALLMRGDYPTVQRLLARIPEDILRGRPRLCLYQADVYFFRGQLADAERRIAHAERAMRVEELAKDAPAAEVTDRAMLHGEIADAKATLAVMRGDGAVAIQYAQTALAIFPADDIVLRCRVLLPLGIAYRVQGDLPAANKTLADAIHASLAVGNLATASIALGMRAQVVAQQGQLQHAADLWHQNLRLTETQRSAQTMAGNAYAGLGEILYEWNDLAAATVALEKSIACGVQWANVEDQVHGYLWLALVRQAQGAPERATEAAHQAQQLLQEMVEANSVFPWLPPLVDSISARLALRQGRLPAVASEFVLPQTSIFPQFTSMLQELKELTLVRLSIAQGQEDDAARILGRLLPLAQTEGRIASVIEILLLQALIHQARSDFTAATATLAQAQALAMSEGYVRLFVDEGASMRALLARLREHQPLGSAERRYTEALLAAFAHPTGAEGRRQTDQGGLIEPLSGREHEVLRLVAQGRTNQEIAGQLVVAVSTIKTHIHHIFAKLQTADRLGAVTRARERGLLEG